MLNYIKTYTIDKKEEDCGNYEANHREKKGCLVEELSLTGARLPSVELIKTEYK